MRLPLILNLADWAVTREMYQGNRQWGDGRLVATWYAAKGRGFPLVDWNERLSDEGEIENVNTLAEWLIRGRGLANPDAQGQK